MKGRSQDKQEKPESYAADWLVRTMRPEELRTCAQIFERAWRQAFPDRPRRIDASALRQATIGERMLVAVRSRRIGGFVAVYPPDAFVHHLYVALDCQRIGLGRGLLIAALASLGGGASLKCELANHAALSFYRQLGWSPGERGEDELGHAWIRLHSPVVTANRD